MSINEVMKNCVPRKDGRLVCWDKDDKEFVLLEFTDVKRTRISPKELTEDEIVELITKAYQ